jgi:hypothetical protein
MPSPLLFGRNRAGMALDNRQHEGIWRRGGSREHDTLTQEEIVAMSQANCSPGPDYYDQETARQILDRAHPSSDADSIEDPSSLNGPRIRGLKEGGLGKPQNSNLRGLHFTKFSTFSPVHSRFVTGQCLGAWCETQKTMFQGPQPRGFQGSRSGVLGLMHQVSSPPAP